MLDFEFLQTMLLTFEIATITTLILLPLGILLGYIIAYCKKTLILEVLVWLPLVLPPSVLGFYLLIAFSPNNFLGRFLLERFDLKFVFSFEGLILASIIFSLPFMVNPLKEGYRNLPKSLQEASYLLGKGKFYTMLFVLLPNMKSSILLGIITTFVHTIGEFGVVMMIGGNIKNETRVASIAIYEEVDSLNFSLAHKYSFSLFLVTFILLLVIFYINKRYFKEQK
ncbi:MAG: molybdate ABC transporter permease subunit [Helicobacteraceae bacterium]|nr:molybdate ABC transporter permease subunit [Helicobacteraceae bacterium]